MTQRADAIRALLRTAPEGLQVPELMDRLRRQAKTIHEGLRELRAAGAIVRIGTSGAYVWWCVPEHEATARQAYDLRTRVAKEEARANLRKRWAVKRQKARERRNALIPRRTWPMGSAYEAPQPIYPSIWHFAAGVSL